MDIHFNDKPMLIIKYYEWIRIFPGERHVAYELCKRDVSKKEGVKTIRALDKETALGIVEEFNFPRVHKDRYGIIWEKDDISLPTILEWIKKKNKASPSEMDQTNQED